MKHTRSAGVYQHPNTILFYAQRRAQAGFCVASRPVIQLLGTSPTEEIGSALLRALDAYEDNLPDPGDWKAHRADFLRATGFTSWKSLEGPARSCWIEQIDDSISFTPLRNGGSKGKMAGFRPFGKEPVVVSATLPNADIGNALLLALSHCE